MDAAINEFTFILTNKYAQKNNIKILTRYL